MNGSDYHQVAAFVAAKEKYGMANAAYSVYDMGELLITRCVSIPNVSEHRALLMAAWSAVHYCKEHTPTEDVSVYFLETKVPNELTSVWYADNKAEDYEDSDRIMSVLKDCCGIKSVAFGVCTLDADPVFKNYVERMRELIEIVNK